MNKKQYRKERHEWLKSHHMCVVCKKQDAYTLNGRALCFECCYAQRIKSKKYRLEHKKEISIKRKEEYEQYRQNGICTNCHKRKALTGHFRCNVCLGTEKKYYAKKHITSYAREDAIKKGMCCKCLKEKVKPGYKVCENCYEQILRASANTDHSYFKASNSLFFLKGD